MKLVDRLRFACFNIFKSRRSAAAGVVIVALASALIMVLAVFGINFSQALAGTSKDVFYKNGTYMFLSPQDSDTFGSSLNAGEISALLDALKTRAHLADMFAAYTQFTTTAVFDFDVSEKTAETFEAEHFFAPEDFFNINSVTYTSYYLPVAATGDCVLSGRIWSPEDAGSNKIWVSDKAVRDCYTQTGRVLSVGSEVVYRRYNISYIEDGDDFQVEQRFSNTRYEIAGIFDSKLISTYYTDCYIYADLEYSLGEIDAGNLDISFCVLEYKPKTADFDFDSVFKALEDFHRTVNGDARVVKAQASFMDAFLRDTSRFQIGIVHNMKMTTLYSRLIALLVAVLSVLITVVCFGNIAGIMLMSIDRNKRTFALLNTSGLKRRDASRLLDLEAAIQVFAGAVAGIIILFLILPAAASVLDRLILLLFSGIIDASALTVRFSVPFYVPVLTVVLLTVSVVGFARLMVRNKVITS